MAAETWNVKEEYELRRIWAELPAIQRWAVTLFCNHEKPEVIKERTGIDEGGVYEIMKDMFMEFLGVTMQDKEKALCNN